MSVSYLFYLFIYLFHYYKMELKNKLELCPFELLQNSVNRFKLLLAKMK